VSGSITQTNGAYIPFSCVTDVLPPSDNGDPPQVIATIESGDLNETDDVTVIMRVSETWPSVLDRDDDPHPGPGIRAAWKPKSGLTFELWGGANGAAASKVLRVPSAVRRGAQGASAMSRIGPYSYRWSGREIAELYHGRWWERTRLIRKNDLASLVI